MYEKLKTPDNVAVTATCQTVTVEVPGRVHTLRNIGSNSIYVLHDPATYTQASATLAGLAAALLTAGCVEIKAGEALAIEDMPPWFHVVCASTLTSTLQIELGQLANQVTVEANLGQVGLNNKAEEEINPAVSVVEDAAHVGGESINPVGGVRTDTRAALAGTTGDWAPVQLTATGDQRTRDDDLNTDMDTLLLYISPPVQTALGTKATSAAWDANTELTIPANAIFVDVYCTTETHLICNTSADDPTTDPSCYPLLATSRIPCRGQTKLHYKALTTVGAIYVTAFCTA